MLDARTATGDAPDLDVEERAVAVVGLREVRLEADVDADDNVRDEGHFSRYQKGHPLAQGLGDAQGDVRGHLETQPQPTATQVDPAPAYNNFTKSQQKQIFLQEYLLLNKKCLRTLGGQEARDAGVQAVVVEVLVGRIREEAPRRRHSFLLLRGRLKMW